MKNFINYGITSRTIRERYSGKLPYTYEVVQEIKDSAENVFKIEKYLKTFIINNNLGYRPNNFFEGSVTECFKLKR